MGWRTPVASATKGAVREAVAGGVSSSRQAKKGEGEGRRAWRLGPVGTCRALPGTRAHPPPSVRASPGPPVTLQTGRPRGSSGWVGDPWLSNRCERVWVRLAQAAKRAGGGVPPPPLPILRPPAPRLRHLEQPRPAPSCHLEKTRLRGRARAGSPEPQPPYFLPASRPLGRPSPLPARDHRPVPRTPHATAVSGLRDS